MLRTQFSPLNLPGLALWLDASDTASMFDATTGGSVVTNGGAVARWQDKSGNGRNATQGTANNRPTFNTNKQNGLPSLTFDGTNDSLATASFAHSQPLTVFVLQRLTSTTTQPFYSRIIEHGDNNGFAIICADSGVPNRAVSVQYASSSFTRGPAPVTSPTLLEMYVDSSATRNVYLNINGVDQIATTRTGTPTTTGVLTISNYTGGGNYYMPQEMYEIVYYNRFLSSNERTLIRNYLNRKWKAY